MNNIKNMREKAEISRLELHRMTGIPLRTLEDWEFDKVQPKHYHRLKSIAKILDCSIDELMIRKEAAVWNEDDVELELESVEKGTSLKIYDINGDLVLDEVITIECGMDLVNYLKKDKDISVFMNTKIMFPM